MKDILDREIKIGDIVAHGTRSGNGGSISIKIVADKKMRESRWSSAEIEVVKVINYSYITRKYNQDTEKWEDVEPHYEKGGTGWSEGGTFLIVNESIPEDLKEFLVAQIL